METIYSQRIILRPPSMRDMDSITRYAGDRSVYRNTAQLPHPYRKKDAQRFIRKCQRGNRQSPVRNASWVIVFEDEVIGAIGLRNIEPHHKAEIGYWLGKPFRGRGLMTEAVGAVCAYAKSELGLVIVYAYAYTYNPASAKVLTKNGFIKRGTLPKFIKKDGALADDQIFIIEL